MRALILVVVVVILGGGAYWLWGPAEESAPTQDQDVSVTPNPATTTTGQNEPVDNDAQVVTSAAELEALFASGNPIRCEYESSAEGMMHSGTIYHSADDDGYRITGATMVGEEKFETNMILRDSTLYTWGSSPAGETAYQMALPEDAAPMELLEGNMEMPATSDDVPPVDTSVRYECSPAELTADMFTLPEGVEFMNMSDMMPTQSGM